MMDAIDELVARSKDHPELRKFHAFHRANLHILDFLVLEIRLRIDHGLQAYSFNSLWEYARWKIEAERGPGETFLMNDHMMPFYGRATVVLHNELNGRCEFRKSIADELFGLEIAPEKLPGDYARRLCWAGGIALEDGWQPSKPHLPTHTAKRKPDIH